MSALDLYRANFECEQGGNRWNFGLNYQQVSGTNDADTLEEFAIDINGALSGNLHSCMSDLAFHRLTEVYPITENDEIPGQAPPLFQGGTVAGDVLPSNMAAKGLFTTNAPNSKFNGSVNFSGVPVSFQDAGRLTAGAITAYITLLDSMIDNITGVGSGSAEFAPVVVSRWLNGQKRVSPVPYAMESASISTRIGNMRRRTTDARAFVI